MINDGVWTVDGGHIIVVAYDGRAYELTPREAQVEVRRMLAGTPRVLPATAPLWLAARLRGAAVEAGAPA